MPLTCAAYSCTSGYRSNPEKHHFFRFPKSEEGRRKWAAAIGRGPNFEVGKRSVVCDRHFAPNMSTYERKDSKKRRKKGLSDKLKHPRLDKDAVPHQLPGAPSYMSTQATPKRSGNATASRRSKIQHERDEQEHQSQQEADAVSSLTDVVNRFNDDENSEKKAPFSVVNMADSVLIAMHRIESGVPSIAASLQIKQDLSWVATANGHRLSFSQFASVCKAKKITHFKQVDTVLCS